MKYNFKLEQLDVKYINSAIDLVISAYQAERRVTPSLPHEAECQELLQKSVEQLFKHGTGIVAVSEGELIGFLAGWKVKELFGKENGVYIPLYGHGVISEDQDFIEQEMYKAAADIWVQNACLSHAITHFAHNQLSISTWFWMGFGMRCVDAIRQVRFVYGNNSDIMIKKAQLCDLPSLAEIHREHNQYYALSPIFMPREEEDPIIDLTEWLQNENHHLWIAYSADKPIGYMRIQPEAETFVSAHRDVMNITGAYVTGSERRSNIGVMLLNVIQEWLKKNGYPLCGVDFEAINMIGSRFWNKHFTPYTYSLARRIDERIIK